MIGDIVGTAEKEKMEKSITDGMNFLYELLLQLSKKGYKDEGKNATKQLLNHVKNGGEIQNMIVDMQDTQLMQECLDKNHIIYINLENYRKNTGETVFMFRDKDKKSVEKALNLFNAMKGRGNFVRTEELLKQNEGKSIKTITGLDRYEMELFSKHAKMEMLCYSIKINPETHQNEILVPASEMEKADKILKVTMFELSGKQGEILEKDIQKYLESEQRFKEKLKITRSNDVVYIVDSKNPTQFLSIQKENYAVHNIEMEENNKLHDNMTSYKNKNQDSIMKYVKSMYRPVIVSEKEMFTINSIDKNGHVKLPDKDLFDSKLQEMKSSLKERIDYYRTDFKIGKEYDSNHIYQFKNLTDEQCQAIYTEIKRAGIEEAFTYNSSLAYTADVSSQMEEILNKVIYSKMDELEKVESELYYQGRGKVILSVPVEEKQYIIDADNPQNNICINKNGYSYNANGNPLVQYMISDKKYKDSLSNIIKSMENPVCLTEREFNSKDRRSIIQSRIPNLQRNEAVEMLKKNMDINCSKIMETSYKNGYTMRESENYNEREQAAIHRLSEIEIRDIFVDTSNITKEIAHAIDSDFQRNQDERY